MKYKYLLTTVLCIFCINTFGQLHKMNSNVCKKIQSDYGIIDSCIVRKLGEYKSKIILNADSIIATTIAWEGCKEESIKLSECMSSIVKYTFCTPSMYTSNKKVYASFQPYLTLTFFNKEKSLFIQFDYGINKWMIKNEDESIICHDLRNSALLPLFYILFKNNPLIEQSYKKILQ